MCKLRSNCLGHQQAHAAHRLQLHIAHTRTPSQSVSGRASGEVGAHALTLSCSGALGPGPSTILAATSSCHARHVEASGTFTALGVLLEWHFELVPASLRGLCSGTEPERALGEAEPQRAPLPATAAFPAQVGVTALQGHPPPLGGPNSREASRAGGCRPPGVGGHRVVHTDTCAGKVVRC